MSAKELREQRAALVVKMREILNAAEKESRQLTAEERSEYDRIEADVDGFGETIERQEKLEKREKALADAEPRIVPPGKPGEQRTTPTGDMYATPEYRNSFWNAFGVPLAQGERRSINLTTDADGGYLVTPTQLQADLVRALDNATIVRQLASVLSVREAKTFRFPKLTAGANCAAWATEEATGDLESGIALGAVDLTPHPLAGKTYVSRTLISQGILPVEQFVTNEMAYKFATTEETAYLTGSGSGQPLGVFTTSANGINTDRDTAAASSTVLAAEDLINTKHSVASQYWANAVWIFHRDVIKAIRKIKAVTDGQFLWQPALTQGNPDTLLGHPVKVSEYAPSTMTAGLAVGLFGDFKLGYRIIETAPIRFERLMELRAEYNQIVIIGRKEVDGAPVLPAAFGRLKMKA